MGQCGKEHLSRCDLLLIINEHASTVNVYKFIGDHLVNANFDQVIVKNLIPGKGMGAFYMNVADPFAITKNGKTYLRFMSYPGDHMDYDKTKLKLCTYFWQGKKLSRLEPNWTFNGLMELFNIYSNWSQKYVVLFKSQ